MRRLDIAVVGCGTGGPAAALKFARAGHRVSVFERVRDPGPVGAGLVLQPTGMHVLEGLDLHGTVLERAAPLARVNGVTRGGRQVIDLRYAPLRQGTPVMGIHRGLLFSVLFEAVKAAPIDLHTGVHATRVEVLPSGKARLLRHDDTPLGDYDLVVAADGARSRLRASLGVRRRVRRSRWAALWTVVPDPDRRFEGELFQVFRGSKRFVGFLPVGRGTLAGEGPPQISLFWSLPARHATTWAADGLDAWKQQVIDMYADAAPLLETIRAPEDLIFAGYTDVHLRRMNHGPVVIIGDAAHAMSPQLGQGANLALLDAQVLAECVEAGDELPAALAAFDARRRPHLRYYQWASRFLTPFFQGAIPGLGLLRDALMHPISRLPFFRTWMVETAVGIRTGPFGRLEGEMFEPLPPGEPPRRLLHADES